MKNYLQSALIDMNRAAEAYCAIYILRSIDWVSPKQMKKIQKNSISFRVFIGTLLVALLISFTLGLYAFFSRKAVISQVSDNNLIYTKLLSEKIDHTLSELLNYLDNLHYVDEEFRRLVNTENSGDRFLLAMEINLETQDYIRLYSNELLFYITAPKLKTPAVSTLSQGKNLLSVSDYIHSLTTSTDYSASTDNRVPLFLPLELSETRYLSVCYQKKDLLFGFLIDLDSLLSDIEYNDTVSWSHISLSDTDHHVLSETKDLSPDDNHMIVSENKLKNAPLILQVSVPQKVFLGKLSLLQWLSIAIAVIAIVLFLTNFLYQQSKVYRPLRELHGTLQRIDSGDLDTRLSEDSDTRELSDIYRTINTYIDHVTALRLQSYEERLNRQNIEMQFLQLQLRPHFFLNTLKGIYALAENKEYAEIQEYVLCLSSHFRFLLYDTTKRIELKKELLHTQNYMKMQRIGLHKSDISCTMNLNGVNENTLVPPLILQTFMENSIKYAIMPDQPLQIHIDIQPMELDEGQEMLDFSFRDNGPGFTDEILREMEENEEEFFIHHKGFGNLKRRLTLIYEKDSQIYVYNYPGGGAAVEILIPAESSEESHLISDSAEEEVVQ